jgi:2-dehydro-3-deoxyphosphogluconate aldolase / (4S)-4-hydroxy-2-oxoglutarate aldolase
MPGRSTPMNQTISGTLHTQAVIPVIALDDLGLALPLGQALLDGGVFVAEITFRTNAAAEAIKALRNEYPDLLTGAGTVVTPDQAQQALDSGAQFLVSPGMSAELIRWALDREAPIIPGAVTPGEIMTAVQLGLDTVKFFPAEDSGGLSMLKALQGPFPNVRFVPTGGINLSNLAEYLQLPSVLACGGSWLTERSLIASKNFQAITEIAKQTQRLVSSINRN